MGAQRSIPAICAQKEKKSKVKMSEKTDGTRFRVMLSPPRTYFVENGINLSALAHGLLLGSESRGSGEGSNEKSGGLHGILLWVLNFGARKIPPGYFAVANSIRENNDVYIALTFVHT